MIGQTCTSVMRDALSGADEHPVMIEEDGDLYLVEQD